MGHANLGDGGIQRHVAGLLGETLKDTPVAVIQGARQVGKSTLARSILHHSGGVLVTLDDSDQLAAAKLAADCWRLMRCSAPQS